MTDCITYHKFSKSQLKRRMTMPTEQSGGRTATAPKKSRDRSQLDEQIMGGPKTRTTLLISTGIDRMVEVCAALEGRQKSEIVNQALAEFLSKHAGLRGLSPK